MTSKRKRTLTEEDKTLWSHVTSDVMPLARRRRAKIKTLEKDSAACVLPEAEIKPSIASTPHRKTPRNVVAATVKPKPPAPPALLALDRHERKKVATGKRRIDARVDLHGMRQIEALETLRGFLALAHSRDQRLVLVITGKGRMELSTPFGEDRGVLRRLVPQWLTLPDLRPIIMGFEESSRSHGGAGALYVRLRSNARRRV